MQPGKRSRTSEKDFLQRLCGRFADEQGRGDVKDFTIMKRRFKGERGRRLNRVETASCMCRAAGIPLAKEVGFSLFELLNTDTQDYAQFVNNYFFDKGLLFLSDEISATIKATNTVGEEYTTGRSRLVGIVRFNRRNMNLFERLAVAVGSSFLPD